MSLGLGEWLWRSFAPTEASPPSLVLPALSDTENPFCARPNRRLAQMGGSLFLMSHSYAK